MATKHPISLRQRLKKPLWLLLLCCVATWLTFLILDRIWPLPVESFEQRHFAQVVVDKDGLPLRAFADDNGVWRYPTTVDQVSPLYIEALINYEDRYFYQHFGVNPFSIVRAAWQRLRAGRYISGASTLTMQVARIMQNHDKTLRGKVGQMFRALQLEWHYSKTDILNFYLNYAPFGGPLEGVEAATHAYLGKSAIQLTHAEAALLAVMPQAPSLYRPDRYPERAQQARDKVLNRLADYKVWSQQTVQEARHEPVYAQYKTQPMTAALLARDLRGQYPDRSLIQTTIDRDLQTELEWLAKEYAENSGEAMSVAVMVVDNQTMAVTAYLGSADFFSDSRAGQVDMIQAVRSPGSTLKPFIYGLALDQGLIHSQSLLLDVPMSFDGYRPHNFSEHFSGPVSASEALLRSLNMPAVQLLDAIGPEPFYAAMHNAGLNLQLPNRAQPNLSMALGGGGVNMAELMQVFSALGRNGQAGFLRYVPEQKLIERPLLSAGSAWIVQDILSQGQLEKRLYHDDLTGNRDLAFKTGTSYGGRDAWAVGVNTAYTIGVWVGRPDGAFVSDNTGRLAAVPLLRQVHGMLPKNADMYPAPASVQLTTICWPLGTAINLQNPADCHRKKQAYTLNNMTPPTRHDGLMNQLQKPRLTVLLNNQGERVTPQCSSGKARQQQITVWPVVLEPWLPPRWHRDQLLPDFAEDCRLWHNQNRLEIVGIHPDATLYPEAGSRQLPSIELTVAGSTGRHYWFLNDRLINNSQSTVQLDQLTPGHYQLRVIDQSAQQASLNFEVAM
ncbi:penicillin-binding protein 1C [Marinicella gelatinilytica]|uniref:penicillin-binding protein 1C n=1 Tax=Marinicella gelatinilytica TaxID=2996017 RepID=UPI002260B341|nr:penicillin-binding protein 1C [Marinicella gelatinilytica]MCX7543901.1 penicillin-binding protein 1C [Marinicella gelatinilytica]